MLSNLPSQIQQEMDFIRPIVEERFAKWRNLEMSGKGRFVNLSHLYFSHYTAESQNDMLMWLMSEAKGVERSLGGVARRLLTVNLAAIRTTSQVSDNA
jgi:hypothetical protein